MMVEAVIPAIGVFYRGGGFSCQGRVLHPGGVFLSAANMGEAGTTAGVI